MDRGGKEGVEVGRGGSGWNRVDRVSGMTTTATATIAKGYVYIDVYIEVDRIGDEEGDIDRSIDRSNEKDNLRPSCSSSRQT